MVFGDLEMLTAQLLTVAAMTKVIVELLKPFFLQTFKREMKEAEKQYSVYIISLAITLYTGISLFETSDKVVFYVGAVGASFIASLGANAIHDVIKVLRVIKSLKK